jgi:glycine/D-amino acid oxidase-like deaminating enzyme
VAGRLTIIGGGVMELMTAYYAAPLASSVTVLERSRVGDPATASFGLTRSVRNDYRDPAYARTPSRIASVEDFVAECVPGLRDAEVVDVATASGVDTCWYDLVADEEFILGAVPGADDVFTGVGWRGTGYKFAPWVGKVLAQLAVQRGTVYDIGRFTPARFAGGAAGEPLAGGMAS